MFCVHIFLFFYLCNLLFFFFFFFFQAEDGIRDLYVTGVQTCALPILKTLTGKFLNLPVSVFTTLLYLNLIACQNMDSNEKTFQLVFKPQSGSMRSEERRVGKECRSRWSTNH